MMKKFNVFISCVVFAVFAFAALGCDEAKTASLPSDSDTVQTVGTNSEQTENSYVGTYVCSGDTGDQVTTTCHIQQVTLNADKTAKVLFYGSSGENSASWYLGSDPTAICIDVVDAGMLFIRDGRIYDDMSAMQAKDQHHSLPIQKQ